MPAVPADVLAPGVQGAHLHQRPGRADEHGGEVEAEDRLWPRRGRQPGRDWKVGGGELQNVELKFHCPIKLSEKLLKCYAEELSCGYTLLELPLKPFFTEVVFIVLLTPALSKLSNMER